MRKFEIIVAGLNPQTGETRRHSWPARFDNVPFATEFEQALGAKGFITTYIDTRKDAGAPQRNDMERAAVGVEYPYVIHSLGTKNGNRIGDFVDDAASLKSAIEIATDSVGSWRKDHNGVQIYRAIKLVRCTEPPIEVIDL